jgi:PAS domain S-box-containing protein
MTRILVVDDDEAVRSGIVKLLRKGSYSPLEAANGRAGVELARKELPDLVLCDLNLPEVDGYEVLRCLRAQPATAAIPVILMTGARGEAGARGGMERGADDFLLKPFQPAALLAAIEARLERNRAQRSVQARAKATEIRFVEILSSLGEGVIWADAEQRVTFANRAADEIVGLEPGGMVGRRFQEFLTEPSKAAIQRNVELRKAGRKSTYELEVVTPDGSHRQVAVTGTPQIGADGTFCGSFVVLRNISEQKRTERTLVRERILLRTLIDHLPCCVYAKDRSGRKTLANPADVRSIGARSEADVLGKTDLDLFPWKTASRFLADDLHVIQTGQAVLDR